MLRFLGHVRFTAVLALAIGCAAATEGCSVDDSDSRPPSGTAGQGGAAGNGGSAGSTTAAGGRGGSATVGTGGKAGASGAAGSAGAGTAGGAGGAAGSSGSGGEGGGAGDGGPDDAAADGGADVSIDSSPDAGSTDDASDAAATDANDAPSCPGVTPADAGDDVAQGGGVFMTTNCGSPPVAESPPNAFDNDVTTKWLCFLQNFTLPTIEYRFLPGATYAVNAYTVTSGNDASERDPGAWSLEGSNDGTTWTTLDEQAGQTFAFRRQTNTYLFSNCADYARYRFVVKQLSAGDASTATIFQVSEIQLFGPQVHAATVPPNRTKGGTVTTPSTCGGTNPRETPAFAFDTDFSSKWFCGGNTAPTVEIALNAARTITAYSVTSGNDSQDRDPKTWILQGTNEAADAGADAAADASTDAGDDATTDASTDASTWTTVDTQTDQTFAARFQTNLYTVAMPAAFTRYRLVVTANAGSVDFQVGEIMLFGN